MGAGIPNITGYGICEVNIIRDCTGSFVNDDAYAFTVATTSGRNFGMFRKLYFNASKSNPLYGNSGTITPLSQSSSFMIKY